MADRNRIYFDLNEEQGRRLRDLVPWGLRSQLISIIIEDLLSLIEKHGAAVIALVIEKKVKPREIFANLKELK